MPIKSTPANQSANIHWTTIIYLAFGEYKNRIALSWRSIHWNISLPHLLSFLSFPQRKLNFFLGSSPHWVWGKMLEIHLFTHDWWLIFLSHGLFECKTESLSKTCASAQILLGSFSHFWIHIALSPYKEIKSCHSFSFLPHAILAWTTIRTLV